MADPTPCIVRIISDGCTDVAYIWGTLRSDVAPEDRDDVTYDSTTSEWVRVLDLGDTLDRGICETHRRLADIGVVVGPHEDGTAQWVQERPL